MNSLCQKLLQEVESKVLVKLENVKKEATCNMFLFGIPRVQFESLTKNELSSCLRKALHIYIEKWIEDDGTLYCWFDSTAAQIRFSMISRDSTNIPFSCSIVLVKSITEIIDIAWSEYLSMYGGKIDLEKTKNTYQYHQKVYCYELFEPNGVATKGDRFI